VPNTISEGSTIVMDSTMNDSAGSQTATALYNAIKDQEVSAVLPKLSPVIQIDASEKLVDAANLLWKHGLLAIPVYHEDENKYIGYFDMRDILRALLNVQQKETTPVPDEGGHDVAAEEEEEEGEELEEEAQEKVIRQTMQDLSLHEDGTEKTLVSMAERRRAYCCRQDDSLEHLCTLLAQSDCRRVLIYPDGITQGRCSDMVSRSTLMKYLASHVSTTHLQETLGEAGLDYRKKVVSIHENATAKQAFELILKQKLYGIAVVDDEGGLVGNTSARDIKLVALHHYDDGTTNAFDLDVLSFLAGVRQEDSPSTGKKAKYPACNVRESSTVGHVLCLLAKTGYHRVFVTNDYMEPVGVISEQDILRFLLSKGKIQLSHDLPKLAE
jgi:CBS domain-containing protein